jgi:DNA-binding transcriptional regulator WhiA
LGNLFVAIGNTELSNKMVLYTTDQELFTINIFYSSGGLYVAMENHYHLEFSVHVAQTLCAIFPYKSILSRYSIVQQWLTWLHFVQKQAIMTDFPCSAG